MESNEKEIIKKIEKLNVMNENLLTIYEAADYLGEAECEVAFKIENSEIDTFNYEDVDYIDKENIIRILEGRINQ